MSHYAEYRLECYNIHSFEDEHGLFACKAFDDDKRLHIEDMWVKPEFRDKKIGQEYQAKVFNYAKENGYEKIECVYAPTWQDKDTILKSTYMEYCVDF